MRIAFVTRHDPRSRWDWSGTIYFMYRALKQQGHEVKHVGRSVMWPKSPRWRNALGRVLPSLRETRDTEAEEDYIEASKRCGRLIGEELRAGKYDIVFAPAGKQETAFLETNLPVVLLSDATAAAMQRCHGQHVPIPMFEEQEACERRALQRAARAVFPSQWAADSAIEDYGADPEIVRVIAFGANLMRPPARRLVEPPEPGEVCRLLFLGLNWEAKGGPIALEAYRELKKRGCPVALTICGPEIPESVDLSGAEAIPTLSKSNPIEYRRLLRLFERSHFMLVPTRADCWGIVFCEACAYGMPIISTQTGGVPAVVREGVNGHLLPLEADGAAYADIIEKVWKAPDRYAKLAASAREEFEERLNWRTWAEAISGEFESCTT